MTIVSIRLRYTTIVRRIGMSSVGASRATIPARTSISFVPVMVRPMPRG